MLPAFPSLVHRKHAIDNSSRRVPALKVDPLLPSRGQPTGYDNDNGFIFDRLLDDADLTSNEDRDEHVAYLPVVDMDEEKGVSGGFNSKASGSVSVLDTSISLAATAPTDPELEGIHPQRVIVHVPPIKVIASSTDHDPNSQCAYRKGKCLQPRAVKKNGALHTLCAFHREKSCVNQKAFDGKKRNRSGEERMTKKKTEKEKEPLSKTTAVQLAEKKTSSNKKKKGRKTTQIDSNEAKRIPRSEPAGQKRKRAPSGGQPARTRSATTTTVQPTASLEANAPVSTPLEPYEPQQRKHEAEQDERDFFEAFALVLDDKQLSRAKKAATTQFLHDTMILCKTDAAIAD